jgi:hypothetical protein
MMVLGIATVSNGVAIILLLLRVSSLHRRIEALEAALKAIAAVPGGGGQ